MAYSVNNGHSGRRVVITGLGVITACGQDIETFWNNVCHGNSGATQVTRFDTSKVPTRIAAEIHDFEIDRYLDARKARRLDLCIQYGIAAAMQAVKDAGIDFSKFDPDRVGVVEGTSVCGMESTLKAHVAFLGKGYRTMSPFTFVNAYCGGGSGEIALALGVQGHAITYCSGSASSNDSLGYALDMIQSDTVDVMVAGGTEAPLVDGLWSGLCLLRVMTRQNERPKEAMRPFDRSRDGFLLGEGAAFMVLEELSHALDRGAKIYAEIAGHGRSCEAYHSVLPHPEGIGLTRAVEKALRAARLHVTEIDYINAHGTATDTNDVVESLAIKRSFHEHANRVAVSATKPVTGHLLGAAGAVETVICALALHRQMIPPTINLTEPAEDCDLDYVPGMARPYPLKAAMNLNSGFGGKNSCLILNAYQRAA
jgi:3-oxoacyl-[acyl-carrier-protein] synthase II